MLKTPLSILACLCALLVIGCATPKAMPYKDNSQPLVEAPKSVYLLTVKLENGNRPDYQPDLFIAHVETKNAQGNADCLNFIMDTIGTEKAKEKSKGSSYYLRLELAPGEYVIRGFTGMYQSFLLRGSCYAPLHADLNVTKSGTYYLGHLDATIRERKENQFKAGPSIPLIDQAACGFSNGTFDIVISDNEEKDLAKFKELFPQLTKGEIQKAILPAFDREKAQKYWETH
jgi:hypothetical protein